LLVTWDIDTANLTPDVNVRSVKYDNIDSIKTMKDGVIVFDSLQHFISSIELPGNNGAVVGVNTIPLLRENGNTLVFLVSTGITEYFITAIASAYQQCLFFQAKFLDLGQDIVFDLHQSKMTARQLYTYKAKQILQGSEVDQIKKGQVIAQEACNIVYPDDIEAALASTQSVPLFEDLVKGSPSATRPTLIRGDDDSNIDTVIPGSLSSTTQVVSYRGEKYPLSVGTLLMDAPKLRQLSTFITLLRDKRHVVYTRYAHHYGGQLIAYLLSRFVGSNVYECYTLEQQDAAMEKFNKSPTEGGVIITTLTLNMGDRPLNVDYLHLVDGSLSKVEMIISNIYKYRNYIGVRMPPKLAVHSYICVTPNSSEPSIDEISYMEFCKEYTNMMAYWNEKVLRVATPIIIGVRGNLVV
jgi:hypothetical protein